MSSSSSLRTELQPPQGVVSEQFQSRGRTCMYHATDCRGSFWLGCDCPEAYTRLGSWPDAILEDRITPVFEDEIPPG